MLNFTPARIAFILSFVALMIFLCLPNFMPASVLAKAPSWWKPVQLGLDLRGGSSLLMAVDTASVLKQQLADVQETARSAMRDAELKYTNLRIADGAVFVTVAQPSDLPAARTAIAKSAGGMTITTEGADRIKITVPDKVQHDRELATVSQSIEIVRRRIDPNGTSEASIQQSGSDRIIIQLPGVDNPEHIKELIGKTAKLDFHLLEPDQNSLDPKDLPPGTVLLPGNDCPGQMCVVRRHVEVSGDHLIDAQPGFQEGAPIVNFKFDTAGGRRFAAVTSQNIGQRLAIVLDDVVISAPSIKSQIGASGYIEGGGFTTQSAKDLALVLRAGALPVNLNLIEERSVGPGLGADSIKDGASAAILGGVLVVVFMILAYHTFGVFAVAGQALHMLSLFAILSVIGGSLTLPGIAGAVLSLGMAVDANVLIYERMREESQSGRTLLSALTAGFSNAYATIIDSNLTNLIAAGLLFLLGEGPVKGFAVTFFIGILTSIFSAVMITRLQVWAWYRSGKRRVLPI